MHSRNSLTISLCYTLKLVPKLVSKMQDGRCSVDTSSFLQNIKPRQMLNYGCRSHHFAFEFNLKNLFGSVMQAID